MSRLHWRQSIPFSQSISSPGYIQCAHRREKYFLDRLQLAGKSVLGIGCEEGFQLYCAEAAGASRVVGITDTFGLSPSIEEARRFASRKLGSKVEFIDMPFDEVNVASLGRFDIVFFFDALPHVSDPFDALKRLGQIASTAFFVTTPVVLSDDQLSVVYRLGPYPHCHPTRGKHGVTKRWIIDELTGHDFSLYPVTVWEHDYLTVCGIKSPSPAPPARLPVDSLPDDEGMEDRTAVLVMSCRRYEQCWMPFFTLFRRYWPDCPYRVYLGTDKGSYPGVETIEVGQDLQWASNILHILDRIDADRIILFQEDFLLNAPVDTPTVRKLVRHSFDYGIGSTRLYWHPAPTGRWPYTDFLGLIGPFEDYRFTFQLSIWDKALYSSLMEEGENPWTTEYVAARRSVLCGKPFVGLCSSDRPPIPYFLYAVDKGEWQDAALDFLRAEGIPLTGITKKIRTPLHPRTQD